MKTMSEQRAEYATSQSGNTLYPNTFQHHNFYVDELMYLLTPEEYKVLTFALREIMGWEDKRESHKARIALSCFVEGYQTPHGKRLSYGTGLSMNTVKDCLSALCLFRVLIKHDTHPRDGTEYEINFNRQEIDVLGLIRRRQDAESKAKTRTAKAAISRKAKRGASSDDDNTESRVSCDDSLGGSSDDTLGGMWDDTNETNETHETHEGAKDAPSPDKREPSPQAQERIEQASIALQEYGRKNDVDVELGLRIADPHNEKWAYRDKVGAAFAKVFRHTDGETGEPDPSGNDKGAAGKLFEMKFPIVKALQYLTYAANGGGERYRTAMTRDGKPLTAYHVVNDMDDWRKGGYKALGAPAAGASQYITAEQYEQNLRTQRTL